MVKVKICGITTLDDALAAVYAGADALGFNFYEKSPRYITVDAANSIIEKLPAQIDTVGVFVNVSLAEMEKIYSRLLAEFVQLHGDESPAYVNTLVTLTGAKVIKALRVSGGFEPTAALDYSVDRFLLDSDSRTFGGSGETFDWDAAVKFKKFVPDFFLAGGLTPENVADAVRKVGPFAVDVSSGVESEKGKKDPSKVAAFIRNAKSAL